MTNKKTLTFNKILLFISFLMFVVSCGVKVYFSNSIAIKNSQLSMVFEERTELEKEITKLNYADASLSSLQDIEKRARALGFVDMKDRLISINPDFPSKVASVSIR